MNDTMSSLLNQLVVDLEARKFERYSDEFLLSEIKLAIGEINRCRNFTPTDTALYASKYEYLIIPMVRSSIAKIGAEGQVAHTENGIVRTYGSDGDYPKKYTSQIIPLIK